MLANLVVTTAVPWPEHEHVFPDKLSVVLVGREHVSLHAGFPGLRGERANHVVGLKALGNEDGYVHSSQNVLYDRHREFYVLWCLLPLGLVRRESLVAERLSLVESHTEVIGAFLVEYFFQRIAESQHRRRVEPLGVDGGTFQKSVIRTEYYGVCVKQKEFAHDNVVVKNVCVFYFCVKLRKSCHYDSTMSIKITNFVVNITF